MLATNDFRIELQEFSAQERIEALFLLEKPIVRPTVLKPEFVEGFPGHANVFFLPLPPRIVLRT